MKKYILALTAILIFSYQLFAQVNIEKYNNINKEKGLDGNLSIYLSAKTGNTDVQEFGVDGRINLIGNGFYSFIIGQGEYGWNKGSEYSNNALLHLRYIKRTNHFIEPEIFAQINYNKKQLLLFRNLFGGGMRITIKSDSMSNIVFGSSYMFEYEKLDLQVNALHPISTNNHRWSNYLSYSNTISGNSRYTLVVYAQPKLENFKDVRILSENHLGVSLTKTLSLSLQFSLRYDSKPPDEVKDFDTNTKIGFSLAI